MLNYIYIQHQLDVSSINTIRLAFIPDNTHRYSPEQFTHWYSDIDAVYIRQFNHHPFCFRLPQPAVLPTSLDRNRSSSGRRQGYPCRPPTPPYMRFRIRRFNDDTGDAIPYPVSTPAPNGQRRVLETQGSYGLRHCSTTHRDHWLPNAMPSFRQVQLSSSS